MGDILAVLNTGAYTFSMANNYNMTPRPAVVFVRDGHAEVVVRRQTYDDLIRGSRSRILRRAGIMKAPAIL
jgi:diaminopimelate decarboxylase